MSRLDHHISAVRNKLAFHRFVEALAWALLGCSAAVLIAALIYKFTDLELPHQWRILELFGALAVACAIAFAIWRRPGQQEAAVAIDGALKLKEKFSTALFARSSSDPFAQASVLDAEQTAVTVRLNHQFPFVFPKVGYFAVAVAIAAFLTIVLLPAMDLFGHAEAVKKKQEQEAVAAVQAKHQVEAALSAVESMPKVLADTQEFKILQKDLAKLASMATLRDPAGADRKAVEALQEVKGALAEAGDRDRKIIAEQNQKFNDALSPLDEKGPLGDVVKDMKNGKFDAAADDLAKTVEHMPDMKPEDKAKAAQQMEKLAQNLDAIAKDPKVQKEIENKMQQMGLSPEKAKELAQQIQQAANGDKQAQQQVAQQAQQMQQNLQQQIQQAQKQAAAGNAQAQAQLPQLQAQQQALTQALQQAQAQANSQSQAAAMAQGAQQLAQAMQQQAQSAAGQGKPAGAQQMAQAQQAMQNAMNQIQASRQDAQSIAAQEQAAQQAANSAANAASGHGQGAGQGHGHNPNGKNQPGGNNGQWAQGNPNQVGAGQGGPGIGNGGHGEKEVAPANFTQEMDTSEDAKDGKILSGTMIKDHSVRGESKAALIHIAESQLKDPTDEVDADHVPGPSRKAAEEYFRTMEKDPGK